MPSSAEGVFPVADDGCCAEAIAEPSIKDMQASTPNDMTIAICDNLNIEERRGFESQTIDNIPFK
jgi:hypothetical protein